MGGYPFSLDHERLFRIINAFPHELKVKLGYRIVNPDGTWRDERPSQAEQQRIINAIADQASQDFAFQQAVYNRLANEPAIEPDAIEM